jgi:hypothetical protein
MEIEAHMRNMVMWLLLYVFLDQGNHVAVNHGDTQGNHAAVNHADTQGNHVAVNHADTVGSLHINS